MTSWQRRLRFVVAAFGLLLAVVVFLTIRTREAVAPATAPAKLDQQSQSEIEKGRILSTKGSKDDYEIVFEHLLSYANGVQKALGVTANVNHRGGRNFVLTGKQAEVGPNHAWLNMRGDVRLAVSDGLTAQTDAASYTDGEGVVRAPGKVSFQRGRMRGAGVGMTYDKIRDVLWLLDQAEVTVEKDEHGRGTLDVKAGEIGVARGDRYIKFVRDVRMIRDGQIIQADEATAYLSEDEKHVTALELRGNSRITPARGGPGSLQLLTAADINLAYQPDTEILQQATLAGRSAIQLAGERGGRGSRIAAESIDVVLGPDGATLTALVARDNVQTDFAAGRGQPARVVRSVSLDARGEPGRGLTNAVFTDNVEYRETIAGRPPVQRVVRAKLLEAVLNPTTAALEEGKFSGAVRFEEGQMSATAAIARYIVADDTVDLSGVEGMMRPVVADERIRIEARSIQMKPEGRQMVAVNDVRSTMQPAAKKPAGAGTPAQGRGEAGGGTAPVTPPASSPDTRMPGMLAQDEPVSVTADRLEYDGGKSKAVYTGNARLWQGDTSINGNTLALDNEKGDLTVTGAVRTTWTGTPVEPAGRGGTAGQGASTPQRRAGAQPPGATAGPVKSQTLAQAEELHYEDAVRRATYTGSAHLVGAQGDVTGAKIELYLKKDSNDMDRVEAFDAVTVKINARTASGTRMTYFASDERYVMTGSPVKLVECGNENLGRTLTFYKSTDTIIINGNERRIESKGGKKCP